MKLEEKRVLELLSNFPKAKILVYGDVLLDRFIWGEVDRISPEAPIPVVKVVKETARPGGAGNVAINLRSLGAEAFLMGVTGEDESHELLVKQMKERGVHQGFVTDSDRPTTVKTRIIARNQQVVRVDKEGDQFISPSLEKRLTGIFTEIAGELSAVVIEDYEKGTVSEGLTKRIIEESVKRDIPVFVDPKKEHYDWFRRATVITPNREEASQASGFRIQSEEDLRNASKRLAERYSFNAVVITCGGDGLSLYEGPHHHISIPALGREVFDVTGAGDTVIATMALAFASGSTLREAALLANYAAGIVVGKIGTAQVSPEEIIKLL